MVRRSNLVFSLCILLAFLFHLLVGISAAFSITYNQRLPYQTFVGKNILYATSDPTTKEVTTTVSRSSSTATRGKKKSNGKKKKVSSSSSSRNNNKTTPLSHQDIADHVSHMYIHGPQGVLRDKIKKSTGEKVSYDNTNSINSNVYRLLDRHPTLVLNADYQPISYLPLSVWHWQEAIKAVFSGKVTVVDTYPDIYIRTTSIDIPLPSVIALNEYIPQINTIPAFTKRNVYLRDEYTCQYCIKRFHTRDLSLDHVIPRSMGGILNWENAVTSCHACNTRKGSVHINQLNTIGMRLHRKPKIPTQYELASIAGKMLPRKVHPTWKPYLGLLP